MQEKYGAMNWDGFYHAADLLADVLIENGQYVDAIVPANICVALDRKLRRESKLLQSLFRVGRVCCLSEKFVEAVGALDEGLGMALLPGADPGAESVVLEYLVFAHWKLGSYLRSLECLARYRRACDVVDVRPHPFAFVPWPDGDEADVIMDNISLRLHMLPVPDGVSMHDLRGWVEVVIDNYPEFRKMWIANEPQSEPSEDPLSERWMGGW
jgi:hypothetical protein